MKIIAVLLTTLCLSACMYRIDVTRAHTELTGDWRLKFDAYIVEYRDGFPTRHAHPYAPQYAGDPTNYETTSVTSLVETRRDGGEVIGTIRKGTIVTIVQVIEDHHATMGVSYRPYAKIQDAHGKSLKVDFAAYCRNHPYEEIFNLKWIERTK